MKKSIAMLVILVLILGIAASTALAAARYSDWIPARNHPNVYHQIVNRSGGNDAEAVRFANQNSYRVKIHVIFTYKPSNTNVGERMVYLEGGNTYSSWVELGPNTTYNFSVDRD